MKRVTSLKYTIPIILVTITSFYIAGSWLLVKKVNNDSVVAAAHQKTKELAQKMAHDIEVVLKYSDNAYDINDILTNYLLGDVNFIAVYDSNDSKMYESISGSAAQMRTEYFHDLLDAAKDKNRIQERYEPKEAMIYNLVPFVFPSAEGEILSERRGFVYFEYSLSRDMHSMQSNAQKLLLIYIIGNVLLILIIIYFVHNRIINRILLLSRGTKAIGNGFLDYRLDYVEHVNMDELDMLFSSFNNMADSLSDKEDKVKIAYAALIQKTREANRANNAKSDFLANMSHEIRTPLNAMLGFIHILQKKEDDKERLKYFKIINDASSNLLGIINDILDFSKIESGKVEIDLIDFNLQTEFITVFELYRHKAEEKKITFTLTMDERLPEVIRSDPLRIKQVIGNLLSNAVKFSKVNGHIQMRIKYDFQKEQLHVDVEDDGIGIEESKQKNIFKAFTQSDSSITRKYGGTGLGLAISYQLVELLGGKLSFTSRYNEGTRFSFYVPVKIADKAAIEEETGIVMFSKQKILLVEDNKSNQMLMSLILDDFNLQYDIASDGQQAVELFQSNNYDMILMDENMPKMNGIEATKKIRLLEKETAAVPVPIIALTANVLKGDRERFLKAGMNEYLSKPFDKMKLQSLLKHFISLKESNRDRVSTTSLVEIKKEGLSALFGLSTEDIGELLDVFYENAKKEIKKMQKAIRTDDLYEIGNSAHAIRGSAANLRLDDIAKSAEIIEYSARKKETIEYTWYYEQLDKAIEKIHVQ